MKQEQSRLNQIAFENFIKVMEAWTVPEENQLVLLGSLSTLSFLNIKNGNFEEISSDLLKRIKFLVSIYQALRILFRSREQAEAWIKKPNMVFENLSALEFMLKDEELNIEYVYRYLRSQLV